MVRCSNCGQMISDKHLFCEYCGLRVTESGGRISDQDRRYAHQIIVKSVAKRSDTDIMISPLWAIIPFIISITMTVLAVSVAVYWFASPSAILMGSDYGGFVAEIRLHFFIVLWLTEVACALLLTKLAYDLVWRQGKHFIREQGLVDAVTILTLRATGRRVDERLSPRDERPRRPMFWAFVIFAPTALSLLVNGSWVLSGSHSYSVSSLLLAGILMLLAVLALLILQIYMMYFLTEEMRKHHNRWWRFTVGTKRELAMMGYTAGHLRNPEPLPSRGGGLYIILMFLIPFFEFYWFYTLIKDGNSHLLQQRIFENQLIELLRERPPERSSQISVISSA